MRRARLKIVPNVGAASRAPKTTAVTPDCQTLESACREESAAGSEVAQVHLPNAHELADACDTPSCTDDTNIGIQEHEIPPIQSNADKENLSTPMSSALTCEANISEPSLNAVDEQNNLSSGVPSASSSNSRYKARSKVHPVIREGHHRIRTFSSASESEDDIGRRQTRTPLSPMKKTSLPPPTSTEATEIAPDEAKRKAKKKIKVKEKTQLQLKKEAMKRKFAKGQVERNQMTMFDLIYNNPVDGEEPPRPREKLQMRLKPYEVEARNKEAAANNVDDTENAILDDLLAEEDEMRRIEEGDTELKGDSPKKKPESEDEDDMPVPQLRLGPNGEIIIDDKSLVIETTEAKRSKNQLANAPVVIENSTTLVNYGSWRKRQRSARWSTAETARFYIALSMLGTDFSLMEKLFPNRPRVELKRKFKTEERVHRERIDATLSNPIPFDASHFERTEDSSDGESDNADSKKTSKKATTAKTKKGRKTSSKKCDDNETVADVTDLPEKKLPKKRNKKATKGEEELPGGLTSEPPPKKVRAERASKSRAKVAMKCAVDSASEGQSGEVTEPLVEATTSKEAEKKKRVPVPSVKARKSRKTEDLTASQGSDKKTAQEADHGGDGFPSAAGNSTEAATPLASLLTSPLGQMSLEQGGLTVVEDAEKNQAPSFLVPPALAEANPAFAQAEPGSLILFSSPNPNNPSDQLVHVYRVSMPLEPVPTLDL